MQQPNEQECEARVDTWPPGKQAAVKRYMEAAVGTSAEQAVAFMELLSAAENGYPEEAT